MERTSLPDKGLKVMITQMLTESPEYVNYGDIFNE